MTTTPLRPSGSPARRHHGARAALLLATTALTSPLLIASAQAQTLPAGGSVAAGSVAIAQPSATQLAVTQGSQSAVVNWQGFSVGQGSSVTFAQPNASSAILNRVTGSATSSIAGSITANGSVYLVNPNGIAITPSGTVNAGGGFVASTLGISDSDFMAGKRTFTGNGASAPVSNAGTITVGRGGYAALIGGTVSNAGAINVPLGKVGLGSGEQATLDFSGDGFLQVAVPTAAGGRGALIRNSGTITADGGSVVLTAATAREAARNAINISGVIQARSIGGRNGSITIGGGAGGRVRIAGRLDASSADAQGGRLVVTGRNIRLKNATLDASGKTGGGTINIGGGRQSQGPLQRAQTTTIDATTTIRADATSTGNGGNVTVWSDGATAVHGLISATGGPNGGDGGQIETSGHTLDFAGIRVNASATNGKNGTWLLDPENLTVDAAAAGTISTTLNVGTNVTLLTTSSTASGFGNTSTGNGDIFVNSGISWATSALLTLNAYNAIAINAPINVTGAGGVALTYNTASPTNLTFNNGASVDYGATNNGGTLSINSQPYALVYSMADLANISSSGRSALATSLNSTTTYTTSSVVAPGGIYSGTFEGLGHTISNLTINNTTNGSYTGLFGLMFSGTIRDIGLVGGSITGANQSVVGALVGQLSDFGGPGVIANSYSTASVTGGVAAQVGGLVGQVQAAGSTTLITNSYSTGNVTTGATVNQFAFAGGLVGYQTASGANATISGSYATGNVTGGGTATLGGLVGYNNSGASGGTPKTAAIINSYATGDVGPSGSGFAVNSVGGLVGVNTTNTGISSISGSFATGSVTLGSGNPNGNVAGGLVGLNSAQGTNGVASITNSFSTGAVTGSGGSSNGGLVGWNLGNASGTVASISTSYATGRVTTNGYGGTGGLVGTNSVPVSGSATVTSSYWDTSTSGIPTAGIGSDPLGQGVNVTGLTTAQFQNGTLPTNFSSSVWAISAGFYPYLSGIFKNGVQAVSGFAYADGGVNPLSSGTGGAVTVNVISGGNAFGSATTGANGYYYAFGAAGSITNGQNLLAYTGANNSATLASANGVTAQSNVNLYGNAVTVPTTATTLSGAPTLAEAQQTALAASGGIAAASNAINGANGLGLVTSGASFTVDQPVNTASTLFVQTTASGAVITVLKAITLNGGSLGLNAAGALAINAPINANSAPVALGYDQNTTTPSVTNLSFAIGAPLSFAGGGALAINGNAYTLITSMGDLPGLNGQSGRYALAGDLDASGNTYPSAVIGSFSGTLEGLGHTISNLAISTSSSNVGLVGLLNSGGTVRDIGLVGGNISTSYTGTQPQSIGALVGLNNGSVVQAYSTGAVNAGLLSLNVGGLVGQNSGLITRSFVGGSVAGYFTVGGMVGVNYGTITQSYATASVNGITFGSGAGGFAGFNTGTITQAYATGTVSASNQIGGFVSGTQGGSISQAYWDTQTSGRATDGGGATGLATAQFQSGSAAGLGSAFAGGANGLYPYLVNFYPNGVQAVSGTVFNSSGTAPNAGATVGVIAGGASFGSVSSGANGYYYVLGRAGSFGSGASVLAYTGNAATLISASNAAAQSGVNIYGNTLTAPTSATLLSVADQTFVSDAQTAASGNVASLNAINGATGRYYQATGVSFAIDGSGVSTNGFFGVRTTAANSGITVSAPIAVNGSDALRLEASGSLAINAPVTAFGGGQVTLAASFDTTTAQGVSLLNLSFGPGASIDYGAINNGGTLAINGQSYNLLYSMGDVATINNSLAGRYALATDLDAAGNTYTSAVIAAGLPFNSPSFAGTLTGLGHAIANLSISNTDNQAAIGLVGLNTGAIRDLRLVGGSISAAGIGNATGALVGFNQGVIANVSSSATVSGGIRADYIGGLVGLSDGSTRNVAIVNAAATGAVSATSGNIGGLAGLQQGRNGYTATIANSYATGAVSATFGNYAGGLVGINQAVDGGTAAITNSYATGNVAIGGQTSVAGGLVGQNSAVRGGAVASLTNVYVTGVVSVSGSQATAGALIGDNSIFNSATTLIVRAYWDTQTSGRNNAIGSDNANQAGNVTGLTTRQLQGLDPFNGKPFDVATDLGNGATSAFAGGFDGLYPYLSNFFPTGVQVVSGYSYADAGITASNPRTIGVIGGGTPFATASSGANGYYYAFGANGTIASNATLLVNNGVNAATLTSKDGAGIQNVNLYGNAVTIDTMATSLSTALSLADAKTAAINAAGGNSAAQTAINNAGGQAFIASGANFEINQAVSGANTFYVQTTAANAGITVSRQISVGSGGSLGLLASGALTINAPVTINGAGAVNLGFDVSSLTNLAFGAPLTFTNADGSAATSTVGGQALAINGQNYKLLYNLASNGFDAIQDIDTLGSAGRYALATNLTGAQTFTSALAGMDGAPFNGTFEGLGHTITNLTIADTTSAAVGLFGTSNGVIRDIGLVGGAVSGVDSAHVGGLVGLNSGAIVQAYATGAVSIVRDNFGTVGGLVGLNLVGTIVQAYATGAVSVGCDSFGYVGGFVGYNSGGTITQAYATGAVSVGRDSFGYVGGFVGYNSGGTITQAYATGAVSVGHDNFGHVGGLVGLNERGTITQAYATGAVGVGRLNYGGLGGLVGVNDGGTITASYWDVQTSGRATSDGGTGLTTADLQYGGLAALGFDPNVWGGATAGLYPYLASFFPGGVQAVSGFAYKDVGITPLASGAGGAVTVNVIGGGNIFASATTGANGYYYAFGAAGSIPTSAPLLATINANSAAGAKDSATLTTLANTPNQTGVNLYNGALAASTSEIALSAADTAILPATNAAANGNAAALSAISGATGRFYNATGASFTIDQNVTTSGVFAITTLANAPITVANAIAINSGGSLGLLAAGALRVNAPITINGAGAVNLAYDASDLTSLSFAQGAPLTFANADGSVTGSAVTGQALVVNGQTYTLLYNMSDVAAVNGSLAGNYALATNIDARGNSYTTGVIAGGDASGARPTAFSGVLEGLGHAVSNLTVSGLADSNNYVGLIGYSTGTVRDIGVVGGSVAGRNYVGALVGQNEGAIVNAYATSAVRGDSITGGLAGYNFGTITQAYATGAIRGNYVVGGLVGGNANGTISQSYATGAVSGPDTVGGLVGIDNNGTITKAYATGAVSGSSNVGGLIGYNVNGTFAQAYWDVRTSGQANGIGTDTNNQSGNVVGLTTRQLQGLDPFFSTVSNLGDGTSSAFASAANGLYPYLSSFFPKGVQVVSGFAYSDAVGTPLASSLNGAVSVNVVGGGKSLGSATTGANGYYYAFGQPGTIADGEALLAYVNANSAAGVKDSVTLATASDTPVNVISSLQSGVNLYNGALSAATSELTLSAAEPAVTTALNAALTNNLAALPAAVGVFAVPGSGGRFFNATGASFEIDQSITTSNIFGVTTAAGASLKVSSPITIYAGGSLGLFSGGALAVNAAINVNGAGSVGLSYDNSSPTNFTFAQGRALTFANADGSVASGPVAGQSLAINGTPYTLLYTMADLDGSNGALDLSYGANYALAANLTATTTYTDALVGSVSTGYFNGTFEGLGHTVTGLTIDAPTSNGIGLFSGVGGTLRDLGLIGGSITGQNTTGALAGNNAGLIVNVYAMTAVNGAAYVGGLVGENDGFIINAYATGSVTGRDNASYVGGLVGYSNSITNAYATGAVTAGAGSYGMGGLVGHNGNAITNAYATGAVTAGSGSNALGGLVGDNAGAITGGYFDTATTGLTAGIGADSNGQGGNVVGLTTMQLQSSAISGNLGSAFGGGTGLYPYLSSFFPYGVQVVSGFAYQDGGVTPLVSGPNGPAYVSVASNGRTLQSVTTGANGYYYAFVPMGTLSSSAGVAGYTQANVATGAADAVSYVSGTPGQTTSLDISGGWRRDTTFLSSLTTLDAGFAATTAGTPVANFALPNRSIFAVNDFALDSALNVSGTLNLASVGNVTQTTAFSAGTLLLEGSNSASFTLTDAGNQFGRLAAAGGAIDVFSANSLAIAANVSSACGCIISGVSATGAVRVATVGDLTLETGAPVTGDSPVLAAAGAFINNAGANAVTAASGRWLVYSADPVGNTFGGLDSNNTAVWNTAAGAAVTPTGNRYAFAAGRTLTVTSLNDSKTYSEDITLRVSTDYAITGFDPGVAGAYLADTAMTAYTGTASVRSAGASATANVAGSPYAITASLGALASESGYGFSFANTGVLTINRRAIGITADAQSRIYGNASPAPTYVVGGLVNGDTLTGALATSANASSNVGNYAITQGTLANANYMISYVGANLAVTARALNVTAEAQSRIYGNTNPALTHVVEGLGLVNGDALTGALTTSATTTSNVGAYAITQGSLMASNNYTLTYASADLAVTARAITVTAEAQSRIYGNTNPAFTYGVGGLGLVNGDTLSGSLATLANGTSSVGSYGITQGTLANANYAIGYTGANLDITARALIVTADVQSRIYGAANPTLTYGVGGLGLVNGDTLSGGLATSATTTSPAGRYAISQGNLTATPNYDLTYRGNLLTVTQTALSTIDVGVLASSVYRDTADWIALPDGATQLSGVPPITTALGTGVFYSDPRFDGVLVCFSGGRAAASCFAAGR